MAIDYATYLKLPQLLALQAPLARPAVHDEMLFVIVHQAHELWFKQLICELRAAVSQIDSGCWLAAGRTLQRGSSILALLVQHLAILETMPSEEFQRFRGALGSASGMQSVQFRQLEMLSGYCVSQERAERSPPGATSPDSANLRQVFLRACCGDAHVVVPARLRRLYRDPRCEAQRRLADCLIDFDEQMAAWRRRHVGLVQVMIGGMMGTGGSSGARYLQESMERRFLPELRAARQLAMDEAHAAASRG